MLSSCKNFDERIEAWVSHARRPGMRFRELLAALPSVYPTLVLAAVRRMASRGQIRPADSLALCVQTRQREQVHRPSDLLPLPHPLNFEWRFTPETSRSLLNGARDLTDSSSPVLLFGTPGVAAQAIVSPIDRPTEFLGEENLVTRRILRLNAMMGLPLRLVDTRPSSRITAGAIIVDPPWYLDYQIPMLTAAASRLRPSGFILFSAPPEGVRASAESERQLLLCSADRLGLELIGVYPSELCYETPFFERNALAAAGVLVDYPWRRGDLMVFRKAADSPKLAIRVLDRPCEWQEVEIGRMRVFVRTGGKQFAELGLSSVVDGDVLPSVSRSDPRRPHAAVWTSGNRLFDTTDATSVIQAAVLAARARLGSSTSPLTWCTIPGRNAVERMARKLVAISAREADEERAGRGLTSWSGASRERRNRRYQEQAC